MTETNPLLDKHQAPVAPDTPKKTHSNMMFVWLFMAVVLAVMCYGALFMVRQYEHQQQILENFRIQLEQQQNNVELQQRIIFEDLQKELVDHQTTVQTGINDLMERIDTNSARILALSSISRDNWKLAEAQYLLRLAEQRILLEKDSQNALALALSADDVLRDLDQGDLVGVRKLLAEEISVLKLAGFVDREGIYLRLAALSNQIDAIPFIAPLGDQEELVAEEQIPENETFAQKTKRFFYRMVHKLGSYVRVRDHGKMISAVLPPAEQIYLQQNLRLMLEQAQVAVLRNEAQIYKESLVKAQNWINQYYTLNDQATAVLNELKELQQEDIAPELTNFSNSSAALIEYIARQEKMAAARRGGRP